MNELNEPLSCRCLVVIVFTGIHRVVLASMQLDMNRYTFADLVSACKLSLYPVNWCALYVVARDCDLIVSDMLTPDKVLDTSSLHCVAHS